MYSPIVLCVHRRVYLSVAAAAIYMASQASDMKKTQKGDFFSDKLTGAYLL